MAWVYILCGNSGRYYIGSTDNLERRFAEHQRGAVHTTARFGGNLQLVASKVTASISDAQALERSLKRKKKPQVAIQLLRTGRVATG